MSSPTLNRTFRGADWTVVDDAWLCFDFVGAAACCGAWGAEVSGIREKKGSGGGNSKEEGDEQ